MAKVVVKQKAKKVKRKFNVQIQAPEFLNSIKLGTSQVTDLSSMIGKTAKVNLMYVTGNVKNQNIRLTFRVEEVSSGLAKTVVRVYEQIPYYLGRFVKSGSSLIEDSFVCETKDGKKAKIKPFIVTKLKSSNLVADLLRTNTREILAKEVSKMTYDEFLNAVIVGKIQLQLRNDLKKYFPLKVFELRKVELGN